MARQARRIEGLGGLRRRAAADDQRGGAGEQPNVESWKSLLLGSGLLSEWTADPQ